MAETKTQYEARIRRGQKTSTSTGASGAGGEAPTVAESGIPSGLAARAAALRKKKSAGLEGLINLPPRERIDFSQLRSLFERRGRLRREDNDDAARLGTQMNAR